MKIYLASSLDTEARAAMYTAVDLLRSKDFEVYAPVETKIPNAWDYPNPEWGLMVFTSDIVALDSSDIVVLLSNGRNSTAGANWEAGYAYAKGKKVIVVEMTNDIMSLMVANGRWATVKGLDGLAKYDWHSMPKTRTNTEQK